MFVSYFKVFLIFNFFRFTCNQGASLFKFFEQYFEFLWSVSQLNISLLHFHEEALCCFLGKKLLIVYLTNWIEKTGRLGQKKVVSFLEIGWVKMFLSLSHLDSPMCIRIYIFNFKKQQTNKQTNKTLIKKAKGTKEDKWISPVKKSIKKLNLQPLGWRFLLSPTFPEKTFFLALLEEVIST